LQTKSHQAFRDANNGVPPSIPNDIFKPSKPSDSKDEMSIFSGKTHTVATKSNASASSSNRDTTITLSGSGSSSRASSDSPSQMFIDNPQFANVHPSLVSELNSFQGHIKEQIQNAYRNGGELFSGAPMMVDPISSGRVMSTTSAHQANHHQQQQQAMYQQQQQLKQKKEMQRQERLERERQEAEMREIEELERQEVARKQQLQQQLEIQRQYTQQQQEMQRQQKQQQQQTQQAQQQHQLDMQRQQETLQHQQRQEQHRQQMEAQQQQMHQHQHQQHTTHYRQQGYEAETGRAHTAYAPSTSVGVGPMPAHHAQAPPQRHHSQSQLQPPPVVAQTYQPSPLQSQPQYHHPTQVSHPPASVPHPDQQHGHAIPAHYAPPPSHAPAIPQQQHSMYSVPQEYHSNIESTHVAPSSAYGDAHRSTYTQPQPSASYPQETYKYWPAAPGSFTVPEQQYAAPTYATAPAPTHNVPLEHYTPENALRGIAADDRSLQETWQSYMEKVLSVLRLIKLQFANIPVGWISSSIF
jgi:hypothetical protein